MQNQPDADLVRGIRRWDLVAICINGIIGAGIFGLPSKFYALIGTYSLIAFVVCALIVALIILCFAEVSSRFDETGGPYLYAREAFGPATGRGRQTGLCRRSQRALVWVLLTSTVTPSISGYRFSP